jgi:serine/threonine-protein kinase
VVKDTPDLSGVPQGVRPVLEHCLQKDPKKRLRDIGDAMALIESTPGLEAAERPASSRLVRLLAALAAVAAAAFAAISVSKSSALIHGKLEDIERSQFAITVHQNGVITLLE